MTCTFVNRKIVIEFGLWDQIRTDHGMEWVLKAFIHSHLAHLRNDVTRHEPQRLPRRSANGIVIVHARPFSTVVCN